MCTVHSRKMKEKNKSGYVNGIFPYANLRASECVYYLMKMKVLITCQGQGRGIFWSMNGMNTE